MTKNKQTKNKTLRYFTLISLQAKSYLFLKVHNFFVVFDIIFNYNSYQMVDRIL